jgi:hypothetical protein
MLFIMRRFKTLLGLAIGGIAWVLLATLIEGSGVWSGYVTMMHDFGRDSAALNASSLLRVWKYVDLSAFSLLIPGGRSWLGLSFILGCACLAAFFLVRVWWKSNGVEKPATTLAWAGTLTWTLLLNIYVPIYDSILVIPSIVATMGLLKDAPDQIFRRMVILLALAIFAASWVTEAVAQAAGLQILTVLFAALGILQLGIFQRFSRSGNDTAD